MFDDDDDFFGFGGLLSMVEDVLGVLSVIEAITYDLV
jgi:hypothetical protein